MLYPANVLTRQEELRKWWESVQSDERFEKVMVHAIAEWNYQIPRADEESSQWSGVKRFINILSHIAAPPQNTIPAPTAQLHREPRIKTS